VTLDDARKAYPRLGLALYALEPGGPVTLEVHDGATGGLFTFTRKTEAAALEQAFPEIAEAEKGDPLEGFTAGTGENELPDVAEPPPPASVFD
jgi:hypothetical protein